MPQALALGTAVGDDARDIILDTYRITDLSMDTSLDRLAATVPDILCAYFTVTIVPSSPGPPPADPMDRLLMLNVPIVQESDISPLEFVVVASKFARQIFVRFLQTLAKHIVQGSPQFWSFMRFLFATLLPTFNVEKLFEPKDRQFREGLIRAVIKICIPTACLLMDDDLVLFLLDCVSARRDDASPGDPLPAVTRLLLTKLLRVGVPRITPRIVDAVLGCGDLPVILDYIDALDGLTQVHQADGFAALQAALAAFRESLPVVWTRSAPCEIAAFDRVRIPASRLCASSVAIVARLNSVFDSPDKFDLKKWPDQSKPSDFAATVRVCCQTRLLQRPAFAQTLTDALITHLRDWRSVDSDPSSFGRLFRISGSEYLFPACQAALRALLLCRNEACTLALLHGMTPAIKADPTPARWVCRFVTRDYAYLTPRIRTCLQDLLFSLPGVDRYGVRDPSEIKAVIERVRGTAFWLSQEADVLLKETQRENDFASRIFIASILLTDLSPQGIVSEFLRPFTEFEYLLEDREQFGVEFAGIVAHLPSEIGYMFFREMMTIPFHDFVLRSVRFFLMMCPMDVLRRICTTTAQFLNEDDRKLSPVMLAMMPNFERMATDEDMATKFLCGLLETVKPSTPIRLQETVIDAVGLIYVTFKLHKSRTALITAAKNFAPQLKTIIASSLDVEFEFSQPQTLRPKALHRPIGLRFSESGIMPP
jgi:hypothetical protein